jgi:isoquinoline 1-oxidoreductase
MSENPTPGVVLDGVVIEPERYEFREKSRYNFEVERREFLRIFGVMGGGLLVISSLPGTAIADQGGRGGQAGAPTGDLASWLHIDEKGHVTGFTGKVEIGQNIRTSLSQAIADELRVPLASISLVMADTDLTPFDQGTFGSRTTPTMAPVLSKAAATAREMLIGQAAAKWSVDRSTLTARDGRIVSASGKEITYAELMVGQKLTGTVANDAGPAPASTWTLRGKAAPKVDGRAFVTGRHEYTPDIVRPGMLYGHVIRPVAYDATVVSMNDARAKAMPDVTVVRDGNFIGVMAPNARVAKRAAAALATDTSWKAPTGQPTSENVFDHFKQTAVSGGQARGRGAATPSPIVAANAPPGRTFAASYKIPYIAHVPLEPRAAVAEWNGDKVTVWCGTQRPFGVRTEVAQAFHLAEDRVRVITPDMGSAYGGKHQGEHAIEAARLAKAAGRPVKVVYTRPEEFSWGYLRPGGLIDVKASVDANGRIVSWEFDNYNSGNSGLNTPYVIATKREQFHNADSPLKQGSYRGLAATANHYVREMQMDAIARALGVDAVEFRLKHIEDPRLRAVLATVAEKSGWPTPSKPGRVMGIACGTEKGSYIATAAEVSKNTDTTPGASPFTIERLVVVFEAGAIVNPDGLKNQTEGAVVQGLGGALFERIEFANGQILNGTLAQYRIPRFKDVPPIETTLIDRKDIPSAGAGETPIVCVAPAIGSAVRAFGKVAEELPIRLES